MTTQRPVPTGTAQYKPPQLTFTPDVFQLSRPGAIDPRNAPLGQPRFSLFKTSNPRVVGWRCEIYDLRGGVNTQRGRFDEAHNSFAYSSLETRFANYLSLPGLTTATLNENVDGANYMHWANVFGEMVIGFGQVAANALFLEGLSDPELSPINYSPGSSITGLDPLILGGAQSERLVVFRQSAGAQVLSDLGSPPTVDGTMHANTASVRGAIQTTINNNTILMLSDNQQAIMSLDSTVAFTTQPTNVLTNVPSGGYAVGLKSLGGGPLRCWWALPRDRAHGEILAYQDHVKGDLWSTNQEGTDPQRLDTTLPFVYYAADWRDGFAVSDGSRVVFHNGRTIRDLGIFKNRNLSSSYSNKVMGFAVNGPELVALCNAELQGDLGPTSWWLEAYNYELDAWAAISAETVMQDFDKTNSCAVAQGRGYPLSSNTRALHTFHVADAGTRHPDMAYTYLATYGQNPASLRGTTLGSATGYKFAGYGSIALPSMTIPGLEGMPLVVSRIMFLGDVDGGGSGAYVTVTANEQEAHFVTGHGTRHQVSRFENNRHFFYELEVQIDMVRSDSGATAPYMTTNGLPIIIEGYGFIEDLRMPSVEQFDMTR